MRQPVGISGAGSPARSGRAGRGGGRRGTRAGRDRGARRIAGPGPIGLGRSAIIRCVPFPRPDRHRLRSDTGSDPGDGSACYLRFKTSRARLNGLIGPSFEPIAADPFESNISGAGIAGPTPPWWKPPAGTPIVFLRSSGFHPGFTRGQALVSYDPASQVTHVYPDGLD